MSNNPNNELETLKNKILKDIALIKFSKGSIDFHLSTKDVETLNNKIIKEYFPLLSPEAKLLIPTLFTSDNHKIFDTLTQNKK